MFRTLRMKLTAVIMCILTILFIGILVTIYISSYQRSIYNTYAFLSKISRSSGFNILKKGFYTSKITPKKRIYLDSEAFYLIHLDKYHKVVRLANHKNSGYTDDNLTELALTVLQNKHLRGNISNLSYYINHTKSGPYVAFFNNSMQINYLGSLFYDILIIGGIGLILLFIIIVKILDWVIRPVEEAFQKQKQFVSDASHELKTPVAIISSNTYALKQEIGESKWLEYIQGETVRMNNLINDLLELARMDAMNERSLHVKTNLSETVTGIVLPFEAIAYEKNITLEENIENNIFILGDKIRIEQLTAILIDNAMHHTEPGGSIRVSLKQQRKKKILTVSNTGKEIPLAEQKHIFERFYRLDESRSRESGGYGLGLSIAKSIVESHNGRIFVLCKDGWTSFSVILS